MRHDPLDLDANDADGNPIIPENSHVRLGAPQNNDGAQILRRSYSYDNNLSYTARTLAALASGHGARCRATFPMLSARSAYRLC